MFGQQADIVCPVLQWREPKHQTLQPEIQIFPEPAFGHASLEITIGRRHYADIDGRRGRCADPIEGFFLEHAKQLALMFQAQVADLVEEERAMMRQLEVPTPIHRRAGEAAAHMAEQFALEELR